MTNGCNVQDIVYLNNGLNHYVSFNHYLKDNFNAIQKVLRLENADFKTLKTELVNHLRSTNLETYKGNLFDFSTAKTIDESSLKATEFSKYSLKLVYTGKRTINNQTWVTDFVLEGVFWNNAPKNKHSKNGEAQQQVSTPTKVHFYHVKFLSDFITYLDNELKLKEHKENQQLAKAAAPAIQTILKEENLLSSNEFSYQVALFTERYKKLLKNFSFDVTFHQLFTQNKLPVTSKELYMMYIILVFLSRTSSGRLNYPQTVAVFFALKEQLKTIKTYREFLSQLVNEKFITQRKKEEILFGVSVRSPLTVCYKLKIKYPYHSKNKNKTIQRFFSKTNLLAVLQKPASLLDAFHALSVSKEVSLRQKKMRVIKTLTSKKQPPSSNKDILRKEEVSPQNNTTLDVSTHVDIRESGEKGFTQFHMSLTYLQEVLKFKSKSSCSRVLKRLQSLNLLSVKKHFLHLPITDFEAIHSQFLEPIKHRLKKIKDNLYSIQLTSSIFPVVKTTTFVYRTTTYKKLKKKIQAIGVNLYEQETLTKKLLSSPSLQHYYREHYNLVSSV